MSADVATAWQKLNEADGVIPYLDYTTPTFPDDISGAIQELLAGKQDAGGVHEGRPGEVRRVGTVPLRSRAAPGGFASVRPASPGSSATSTCCRRSRSSSRSSCCRSATRRWISLCDWDGLTTATWAGLGNYSEVFTDEELRSAFVHALILLIFYALLPLADRAAAGRRDGAGARARAGAASGRSCSCRR